MTEAECKAKITEILPDVLKYLDTEVDRLIRSGAINLEAEDPQTYGMAKSILTVALENAAQQYAPRSWQKKEMWTLKNLRHF